MKYGTAKTIMRVFKMRGTVDRIVKSGNIFKYSLDSNGNIIKELNEDFRGLNNQYISI
jgi:hypothetical protein